jgi:hypothetical protein
MISLFKDMLACLNSLTDHLAARMLLFVATLLLLIISLVSPTIWYTIMLEITKKVNGND